MTTIYLATGQGISVVRGSREDWEGSTQLQDEQVECVLVDAEDSNTAPPNRLICACPSRWETR